MLYILRIFTVLILRSLHKHLNTLTTHLQEKKVELVTEDKQAELHRN